VFRVYWPIATPDSFKPARAPNPASAHHEAAVTA